MTLHHLVVELEQFRLRDSLEQLVPTQLFKHRSPSEDGQMHADAAEFSVESTLALHQAVDHLKERAFPARYRLSERLEKMNPGAGMGGHLR